MLTIASDQVVPNGKGNHALLAAINQSISGSQLARPPGGGSDLAKARPSPSA
jgi:hypothetical protein